MKRHNSRTGGALVVVIIVMAVLIILGVAFIGVSSAETSNSVRQLNRTQAYFSARSGVEEGLLRIKTVINTNNYQEVTTLFSAVNTPINGAINAGQDTYAVTFTEDIANDRIKIASTGAFRGVQNTTALTIQFQSPFSVPSDWMNPGGIIKSGYREKTTSPVVVNTAKLLGHAPKKESTSETTWKAPSFHFIDTPFSLEITAKKFTIVTNLVSFKNAIFTKNNDDCLVLQTFNGSGFRADDGTRLPLDDAGSHIPDGWGVIALKGGLVKGNSFNDYTTEWNAGYYAYKNDVQISLNIDRIDINKIKKITNANTIAFIEEVIRRESGLSFLPTQMRWSKN